MIFLRKYFFSTQVQFDQRYPFYRSRTIYFGGEQKKVI
ncbi:hypothetical protein FWK35_00001927 [Aphis craccivora]|uniref:Uncharacterized protein n=1 Tax=Aphis craccivora TaxID=307492 RepID=A0A6G0Z127_APHCR|nr:hypothetical protein FWK35_00001927 [Aphis craccivora]